MSLNFGIIGCGIIAPFHADAIAALPTARLVAVADSVQERAQRLGNDFGVDWYGDLDRLLERSDIDVVSICTPSGLHAELGVRAAQAGKHVLVEKPIEIALAAADRLIDACHQAGVKLTVISQHRFDPGVRRMRELIEAGCLGRLILGDAIVKWYRSQGYYDSGDWRGTWALDGGGCTMNQGIHYVDLLQWMMGPVERVFARCVTAAHERIEVEDIALISLGFASGAVGVIEVSTAIYPGLPERLEISGTDGTLVVEAGELTVCELREEPGTGAEPRRAPTGAADPAAIDFAGHQAQIADFVAAVEEGREPLSTGEEARKPLEIILAAYESARTGREIFLPL